MLISLSLIVSVTTFHYPYISCDFPFLSRKLILFVNEKSMLEAQHFHLQSEIMHASCSNFKMSKMKFHYIMYLRYSGTDN